MKQLSCLVVGLLLLVSCPATKQQNFVYQTSTIDALLAGVYDGEMSCGELLKHGDFGIGTFDNLDGEMVVLDGSVYQVRADGKVYLPDASTETPFATVCRFTPDRLIPITDTIDYKSTVQLIDEQEPNQNLFYAIQIDGTFKMMKTRSVPAQTKPYPPLAEVTKNQPVFEMSDVDGTIVGFRCPAYVKGINVPGYHLHFINADRSQGGHILDFEITAATCRIDVLNQFFIKLPADTHAFAETDLSQDRSEELRKVEK